MHFWRLPLSYMFAFLSLEVIATSSMTLLQETSSNNASIRPKQLRVLLSWPLAYLTDIWIASCHHQIQFSRLFLKALCFCYGQEYCLFWLADGDFSGWNTGSNLTAAATIVHSPFNSTHSTKAIELIARFVTISSCDFVNCSFWLLLFSAHSILKISFALGFDFFLPHTNFFLQQRTTATYFQPPSFIRDQLSLDILRGALQHNCKYSLISIHALVVRDRPSWFAPRSTGRTVILEIPHLMSNLQEESYEHEAPGERWQILRYIHPPHSCFSH